MKERLFLAELDRLSRKKEKDGENDDKILQMSYMNSVHEPDLLTLKDKLNITGGSFKVKIYIQYMLLSAMDIQPVVFVPPSSHCRLADQAGLVNT